MFHHNNHSLILKELEAQGIIKSWKIVVSNDNVNYRDIVKNNNIKNPNLIFPSQKLTIVLP